MDADTAPRALSIKEFCSRYSVSPAKFYVMLGNGDITAKKNGRKTVIPVDAAEKWFQSLPAFPVRSAA